MSDHLVTPLMKTFNFAPLRSVTEEVHAGALGVNSRVYADDSAIRRHLHATPVAEGECLRIG